MKSTTWFGAVIGTVLLLATGNQQHVQAAAIAATLSPAGTAGNSSVVAQSTLPILSTGKVQLPHDVSRSWWVEAKRGIEEQEYHFSPVAGSDQEQRSYQAPNRKNNIRTYFGGEGISLRDRTASGSPELVSLVFKGLGRGVPLVLSDGEPPVIKVERNRVELRRQGITEWYINRPAGLEQGFEIPQRPAGAGELSLVLEARGADLRVAGDKILIKTATGRELEYGKLKISDAAGKTVPGRLEVKGGATLVIAMDDTGARYPLSIDPLITGAADETLESDEAGAWFGYSVAGAGDVNGDGYADVIVGAPYHENGTLLTDAGAAYIFYGSAGGLATTAAAILESSQAFAYFGNSVSGAGDVNGDGFADVIVGAPYHDNGTLTNAGAAFVYHGSGTGMVTTYAALLEGNQEGALSGYSVAGAGDVNKDGYADVIVGAYLYDTGEDPDTDEGAAFVYYGSGSGVVTAATVLQGDQPGALFGYSVAGAGDVNKDEYTDVIIGAPGHDNGTLTSTGAAFVFHGSTGGVATVVATQLSSSELNSAFGMCVSGAGDVNGDTYADVIVGAPFHDNESLMVTGAAYVYHGSAFGVAMASGAQLEGDEAYANLGWSVAGAGDVNNDGYADVIVGAPFHSNGTLTEAGAASVYHGSAGGVETTADVQLVQDQAGALFGGCVAGVGDVNNDGFADVIVGAQGFGSGDTEAGAAFVYLGSTIYYTVAAEAGSHGSLDTTFQISPYTVVPYDTISFKFDADPGYHVVSVTGCGINYSNSLSTVTTYTATTAAVTANCEVTATFALHAPIAPVTISPKAIGVGTMTPTYTFNAAAGATEYSIYLWNDTTKTSSVTGWYTAIAAGCPSGTGTCTITQATALALGPYAWYVRAQNAAGVSPWSTYTPFWVGPSAPTLISPSGNAIGTTTPVYTFNAVAGAVEYSVYLWNDTTKTSSVTSWYTASATGCPGGTGTCTITQAPPLADGPYAWYVRARNSAGNGPWSSYRQFSVGTLPAGPVPISPQGTGIGAIPTYTFNPVAGATGYNIYLWNDTTKSGSITSWYTPTAANCPGNTGTCTITPAGPLADGLYAWYVRAQSPAGNGPWSAYRSFNVGTPPAAPVAISPQGSGIGTTPTYTFNPVAGAVSYSIYLWNDTTKSGSITSWYTEGAAGCPGGTGTCSITPAGPLGAGPYVWYVRAQNLGGTGPYSSYLSFRVQ